MKSIEFVSNSPHETDQLATALAKCDPAGLTIGFVGDLGAGKTYFTRSLAIALGVDSTLVNSPTFVLMQIYEGRLRIYHFDTYRLADTDEFLELGADEFLYSDGLCLIEWADRVREVLPEDRLMIEIERVSENARKFTIYSTGAHSETVLRQWAQAVDL